MILLIDIGNTLTKIAIENEINKKNLLLKKITTKDNNWDKKMHQIFLSKKWKIEIAIISSVVPQKTSIIKKIITQLFKIKPIIINNHLIKFLPLKINLKQKEIGSDLIALAIGSSYHFNNAITVSLGTATTYTIVKDNNLIGVIIGPGFNSAKTSLTKEAALIKSFTINNYQSVLGITTNHALSIGYGNGFNYMIDETIKAIHQEIKVKFKVIITGGNFQELQPFLKFKYYHQENLVLEGLRIIYQILKNNNKLK